jgi:anthranilate synthase/aminodeoxychorismate synthase-like glutamine amidotransferase
VTATRDAMLAPWLTGGCPATILAGAMRVLVIDNYDSFTFNLVQYLLELGAETRVVKNDAIDVATIRDDPPDALLVSPGPCTPDDAGVSLASIEAMAGVVPILGVCLGHQAIAQAFGGKVVPAARAMHGKTSAILHEGKGLFAQLPSPFEATRYHSLVVERASLPACLEVTAWTESGEIMALRHRTKDVEGLQFHPESILTPSGKALLARWLETMTEENRARPT